MTRGLELAWGKRIKVLLSLLMECVVVIITSVAKLHNHQIQNLPPCAYGLTVTAPEAPKKAGREVLKRKGLKP